ncbi:MAG: 30S ribosomal protein S6 [Eubacteriales bacterium]|nr:30S ribosomal protein S6 [Eubacteriales bacterium]
MNKYEALYIIKPDLEAEANKAVIDKFAAIVTDNGGVVEKIDEWGKKKLAYPINYIEEGYYVLMNFEAAPSVPAELVRVFGITEDIMRNLVILREE